MRFRSLIHLSLVTRALAKNRKIIVLGSSSLLASWHELGEPGEPLETSFDADFLVEGCDEKLAEILADAIGDNSLFQTHEGYHADILRPAVTTLLPRGWDDRLVPLADCEGVFCLDPHDLAVAKLRAGRPKDIELLAILLQRHLLDEKTIRERLAQTLLSEKEIVITHRRLLESLA